MYKKGKAEEATICPRYGEILHLRLLPRMFLVILIFNIIY